MPQFVYDFIQEGPWWLRIGESEHSGMICYPSAHFVTLYDNLLLQNGYHRKFRWSGDAYFRYVAIFYFYLSEVFCGTDQYPSQIRVWVDSLPYEILWSLDRYLRFTYHRDEIENNVELKCWEKDDFRRFYFAGLNKAFACSSVKLAMLRVFGLYRYSIDGDLYNLAFFGSGEVIEFVEEEDFLVRYSSVHGFFEGGQLLSPAVLDQEHEIWCQGPTVARRFDVDKLGFSRFRDWDWGYRYLYEFYDELHFRYNEVFRDFVFEYLCAYLGGWFSFLVDTAEELAPPPARRKCLADWGLSSLELAFELRELVHEFEDIFSDEDDIWDFWGESDVGADSNEIESVDSRFKWREILGFAGCLSEEIGDKDRWFAKVFGKLNKAFGASRAGEIALVALTHTQEELQEIFNHFSEDICESRDYLGSAGMGGVAQRVTRRFLGGKALSNLPSYQAFVEYKQCALRMELLEDASRFFGSPECAEQLLIKIPRFFTRGFALNGHNDWFLVDLLVGMGHFYDSVFVQYLTSFDWFVGELMLSSGDVGPYTNRLGSARAYSGGDTVFEEDELDEWDTESYWCELGLDELSSSEMLDYEKEFYESLDEEDRAEYDFFTVDYYSSSDRQAVKFFCGVDLETVLTGDDDKDMVLNDDFLFDNNCIFGEEEIWGRYWYLPRPAELIATIVPVEKERGPSAADFAVAALLSKMRTLSRFRLGVVVYYPFYTSVKRRLMGAEGFSLSQLFSGRFMFVMLVLPFFCFWDWLFILEKWVQVKLHTRLDVLVWLAISGLLVVIFLPQVCIMLFCYGIWFLWNFTGGVVNKIVLWPLISGVKFINLMRAVPACGVKVSLDKVGCLKRIASLFCFYLFVRYLVRAYPYEVSKMLLSCSRYFSEYSPSPTFNLTVICVVGVLFVFAFFSREMRNMVSGLYGLVLPLGLISHFAYFDETTAGWTSPYNYPESWRVAVYEGRGRPRTIVPISGPSSILQYKSLPSFKVLFEKLGSAWFPSRYVGYADFQRVITRTGRDTYYPATATPYDKEIWDDTYFVLKYENASRADALILFWEFAPHDRICVMERPGFWGEYYTRRHPAWPKFTKRQVYRGLLHSLVYAFVDINYFGLPTVSSTELPGVTHERGEAGLHLHHMGSYSFFRGLFYEYPFVVFDVGFKSDGEYTGNGYERGYKSCVLYTSNLKWVFGFTDRSQLVFDHYNFYYPHLELLDEYEIYRGTRARAPVVRNYGEIAMNGKFDTYYKRCNHRYLCLVL